MIKQLILKVMGEERGKALIRKLKNRKNTISEAELILKWFDTHPRSGVMVDVGANIGDVLIPYLKRNWKIYAFEPDPVNRQKLETKVNLEKIQFYECAVSDHEEEGVPFYASPESCGISGLSAFRDTHTEVARVPVRTLDKILAEVGEKRVDFLKVDTEGHDLFVLRGFPWIRIQPEVVLCEFEDAKTVSLGYDYRQMGDFLLQQNYRVFLSEWKPIVRYGGKHRWRSWREYPCKLSNSKGWGNFVAFRDSETASLFQNLKKYRQTFTN